MTSLTFGVLVPQGWKMELSSIEDPVDEWAKAGEVAEQLGYDSLWVYDHFHNVPVPGGTSTSSPATATTSRRPRTASGS